MSGLFDDLRDLYQEVILDHGRKPRNFRRLEDATATARGDNPMCGDRIELFIKRAPDGTIAAVHSDLNPNLHVKAMLDAVAAIEAKK